MDQKKTIKAYITLLKEYNQTTNIYSKTAYNKLEFHIEDCIQLAKLITNTNQHVLDIGSGSGLPSVIIAIVNNKNKITAIDSKSRKTKFLDLIKEKLSLNNLTIIQDDINHYVKTNPEIDIVTNKAFAPLEKTLKILKGLKKAPQVLFTPISLNQVHLYKPTESIIEIKEKSETFYYLHHRF